MISLRIAIPTLNCAPTLAATLVSLEPLRRLGAEVVLVDSGSRDGTLELAAQFGIHVRTEPPGNMYAAINTGLRGSETAWVTYINGDDLLYADGVQALMALGERTAAQVVYGTIDYLDAAGRFLHHWRSPPPCDLMALFARGLNPVPQQGTLFRREVFEALGGFDTRYRLSADCDFCYRALAAGYRHARLAHPPVAAFRLHGQQLSKQQHAALRAEAHASTSAARAPALQRHRAWLAFRLRNLGAYVVRALRRQQLSGRVATGTSMDA